MAAFSTLPVVCGCWSDGRPAGSLSGFRIIPFWEKLSRSPFKIWCSGPFGSSLSYLEPKLVTSTPGAPAGCNSALIARHGNLTAVPVLLAWAWLENRILINGSISPTPSITFFFRLASCLIYGYIQCFRVSIYQHLVILLRVARSALPLEGLQRP